MPCFLTGLVHNLYEWRTLRECHLKLKYYYAFVGRFKKLKCVYISSVIYCGWWLVCSNYFCCLCSRTGWFLELLIFPSHFVQIVVQYVVSKGWLALVSCNHRLNGLFLGQGSRRGSRSPRIRGAVEENVGLITIQSSSFGGNWCHFWGSLRLYSKPKKVTNKLPTKTVQSEAIYSELPWEWYT